MPDESLYVVLIASSSSSPAKTITAHHAPISFQEFDTPERLYENQQGIFRGMCDGSSITLDDINAAAKRGT
jgi:hypothetical protein